MFSLLSDKLDDTFRKLRGLSKISESNIADAMREIRMALLDADVEYSVAREFIAHVKEQAMGVAVLKTVKPGEQIVKIFRDQLAELLGGEAAELNLTGLRLQHQLLILVGIFLVFEIEAVFLLKVAADMICDGLVEHLSAHTGQTVGAEHPHIHALGADNHHLD